MSDGPPGEPDRPDDPDEEQLLALDAYIDAPVDAPIDTHRAPGAPAPGEPGLEDLVDRLRGLSEAAWDDAARRSLSPPASPFPPPPGDRRAHRRRPAVRLSRRLARLAVAKVAAAVTATLVVLVVSALVIGALAGQPSPRPVTGIPAVPAAWRLAGYIDQSAWLDTGAATGSSAAVTCATAASCYADDPGGGVSSTVVEVTTDGGSGWQAAPLPPGTRLTSGLACPAAGRCLVGGYTGVPAGSGAPAGGSPSVLATADGGATWSADPLPSGVAQVTDLACTSPSDCVGAGYGPGTVADPQGPPVAVVTTDGGASWSVVPLPDTAVIANPSGLACTDTQSCVLVGVTDSSTTPAGSSPEAGAALYSTDGGRTWSPAVVPGDVARIRAVSCAGATHCTAVANGPSHPVPGTTALDPYGPSEALASTDGGQSWSATGSGGLVLSTLTSISCPTAADCWAAGTRPAPTPSGTTRGVIVVTHDAGASWTTEQLPTEPTRAQRGTTRLPQLDIEVVSSVSCPAAGDCVALGSQGSLATPAQQQIVLTDEGG